MRHPASFGSVAPVLAAACAVALAVALAACGTPGPASPGTPAASSPAASLPDLTPIVPTPVGGEAPPAVVITAVNIEFRPAAVSVPAGTPFALVLDNRDQGVPHGLAVADAAGNGIAKGDIATGPARVPLVMGALAAGSYTFSCQVHPNMTGTLTVTP